MASVPEPSLGQVGEARVVLAVGCGDDHRSGPALSHGDAAYRRSSMDRAPRAPARFASSTGSTSTSRAAVQRSSLASEKKTCAAPRKSDGACLLQVLLEEVAQVGRRRAGRRQGQQHGQSRGAAKIVERSRVTRRAVKGDPSGPAFRARRIGRYLSDAAARATHGPPGARRLRRRDRHTARGGRGCLGACMARVSSPLGMSSAMAPPATERRPISSPRWRTSCTSLQGVSTHVR